jgi:hypothetical protein
MHASAAAAARQLACTVHFLLSSSGCCSNKPGRPEHQQLVGLPLQLLQHRLLALLLLHSTPATHFLSHPSRQSLLCSNQARSLYAGVCKQPASPPCAVSRTASQCTCCCCCCCLPPFPPCPLAFPRRKLLDWSNQHGSIYRLKFLWQDALVVTDPAALAAIMGRGEGAMDKASLVYAPINRMCTPHGDANLLTSAADEDWKAIRKAVAVSFSMQVGAAGWEGGGWPTCGLLRACMFYCTNRDPTAAAAAAVVMLTLQSAQHGHEDLAPACILRCLLTLLFLLCIHGCCCLAPAEHQEEVPSGAGAHQPAHCPAGRTGATGIRGRECSQGQRLQAGACWLCLLHGAVRVTACKHGTSISLLPASVGLFLMLRCSSLGSGLLAVLGYCHLTCCLCGAVGVCRLTRQHCASRWTSLAW